MSLVTPVSVRRVKGLQTLTDTVGVILYFSSCKQIP